MQWVTELTDDQRGLLNACRSKKLPQIDQRWAALVRAMSEMLDNAEAALTAQEIRAHGRKNTKSST